MSQVPTVVPDESVAREYALSALLAEARALDDLLGTLDEDAFDVETPFCEWRVSDIIRHLISVDRDALLALTDRDGFANAREALLEASQTPVQGEVAATRNFDRLRHYERTRISQSCSAELLDEWRRGLVSLETAVRARSEGLSKIEWYGPPMSLHRLLAARQMEIWCYGQDIYDAFQLHRPNFARLRQIADFGVRTRSFSFRIRNLQVPAAPYVKLLAPSGEIWTWGEASAHERIEGSAEAFCLVVTQRRNIADTRLILTGDGAREWMRIAQTIAGSPLTPPNANKRNWEAGEAPGEPRLPHAPTVSAMVGFMTDRFGERPQIIEPSGHTSYDEIEGRSRALARGLLARSVAKGTRIGIIMSNGADFLVALLAVQRIGAVACLLSTFAKGEELARLIRHSDMALLLFQGGGGQKGTTARLLHALPELADGEASEPLMLERAPFLRGAIAFGTEAPRWARSLAEVISAGCGVLDGLARGAEREVVASDPALIIYTSGSSAEPKAVIHSQGNFVRQAYRMSAYTTFEPGDRLLTTMPFFWVGGLVTALLSANYRGGALVCPADPGADSMLHAVPDCGVTHISLWAPQLASLIRQGEGGSLIQNLRPLSAQQMGLFDLTTPDRTPNSLGMTETLGPHSMEYFADPLPKESAGGFGRQVGAIERRIIDRHSGQEVPCGERGEIALRGGHMMLGMHRRERDCIFTRDGWYLTGDMGKIDENGHLHFLDRSSDMVKTAGANVSPREVERALLQLDGIREAIVLGIPDAERDEILVAAIVPHRRASLDLSRVESDLRANLSSYKVPKRFYLMDYDDIPRTPSAKVQRHRLREILPAA